jgi:hypothetical protein
VRSVAGLIRRRGNLIEWQHAIPAHGDFVDRDSRSPRLTAGGPRIPTGPTGEWYARPHLVRGYFSKKTAAIYSQAYGLVDERDAQLDLAVPFAPEPHVGIVALPHVESEAWQRGWFTQFPPNVTPSVDLELIARDLFLIGGVRYIVKTPAIAIQDKNVTVAWRLLIGADTY